MMAQIQFDYHITLEIDFWINQNWVLA